MSNDPDWYAPPKAAVQAPATPAQQGEVDYATFGVRAGARVIDVFAVMGLGFVGGVVGSLLMVALAAAGVVPADWQQRSQGLSLSALALGLVSSLLYHAVSEGLGGATIGKAVLGLRVKRENLATAGVWRGVVRNLGYYIDAFFFGLVAYSVMSKSRTQQRLGDKWAGTVVVRAGGLSAEASGGGVAVWIVVASFAHIVIDVLSIVIKVL